MAERTDIAFYLKLFPLRGHVDAYWKSKSIVCSKSLELLEDNFNKKPIPRNDCPSTEVDHNLEFGKKNGITGTPTLVLPDGSVYSGTAEAAKLIKLIDEATAKKAQKRKKKP